MCALIRFAKRKPIASRRRLAVLAALVGAACLLTWHGPEPGLMQEFPALELASGDRILVLAPHPDDEVIGCGGVIQEAKRMGLPVRVVFLTYGDSNEWSFAVYRKHPVISPAAARQMGMLRHDEAVEADRVLGLAPEDLVFLGYPDFGTLAIWGAHWGSAPALESLLTRVREVPYANAFRPAAPHKGEEILKDLEAAIRDFRPTKVFVSHPADFHFDHRAFYLFTRVALWDLEAEMRPALYPYLVHFRRWPASKGYKARDPLVPPRFFGAQMAWQTFRLASAEVEVKHRAIQKHKTQYEYASGYLLSFVRACELFGDFPAVRLRSAEASGEEIATGQGIADSDGGPPEQLTVEERAAFVGVEWRKAYVEGESLVLKVEMSRPVGEAVHVVVQAFGYRPDVEFGRMPKIRVELSALGVRVLDQATVLPDDSVTAQHGLKEFTVRIPLSLLGDPQHVLASAHTKVGLVPLDWVSWRVLEL